MMSEWDKKFARMVAETERHLASVKASKSSIPTSQNQLHSPSNFHSGDGSRRKLSSRVSTGGGPYFGKSRPSPSSSILRHSGSKSSLSYGASLPSPPKRNVSFEYPISTGGTNSTPITLLSEKIRGQQKDMIALRESLNGMQFYLKQQHSQIMSLKDEMHVLQLKMSESELGSKQDKNLHQFKQEVLLEVEALKRKVQTLSTNAAMSHVTSTRASSLNGELFMSKLQRSEVVTSLQRELSIIKSKQATQDSKVGSVAGDLRDVEKRQDKVTKMVSEVKAQQNLSSVQCNKIPGLRDLLSSLERRLCAVEEAVFMPINKGSGSSTPIRSHDKSRTPFKTSYPMTITDLNISPIGNATTPTKPHPFQGGGRARGGGGKKKSTSTNPLYRAPLRVGFQDLGADGLMSGSSSLVEGCGGSLVESDLEGHTLSCSLELMSDLEVSDDLNSDLLSDTSDTISLSSFR